MDARTTAELHSFDLAAVLAAVRSYAVGAARAPRCGVLDTTVPAGSEDGAGGGQHPHAGSDAEHSNYRGITRDNNGRQQYWIALLYASLE